MQQDHSGNGDNVAGNKIDRQINTGTYIENPIIFKIPRFLTQKPFYTDFFIGRDPDLAAIEADYQENNHLLVLVNGEGGMGKTTLAAQYWFRHEARYKHLAWVFADSGIGNALLSLAANLGVQFSPQDDEKAQMTLITQRLNNLETPCLLVFDNANNAADLEHHFGTLRRLSNCHVLLTSRVTALADVPVHRVLPLNINFAVDVFKKHYPKHAESDAPLLNNLLHAVGFNTLVIELLAKNLAVFNKYKTQYSLQSLVHDLQEKGLFAVQGKAVQTLYQADTLRTETPDAILVAMYDVSALSDMERYLLNNFAVLPAENIPYTVFLELLKPDPADAFDDPLSRLQQKGWIDFYDATTDFKISPVIQHIAKLKNKEALLNDCKTLMDTLVHKLQRDIIHEDNYKMSAVFAHYAETVITAFDTPLYHAALLCERMGTYYTAIGNLDRAKVCYEKYQKIAEQLLEKEPKSETFKNCLATAVCWLGITYSSLGDLYKALEFFEDYNRLERELYADYPNNVAFKNGLAISYEKLGETHTTLGNLDTALGFFEKETVLFEELYATYPNNVSFKNGLAIAYEKLGSTHTALGNLDKALGFFEERNRLGKDLYADYPNNVSFKNGLAISYSKLGETHTALGNLDKALGFFEEDIKLSKELYADYPNNVSFKNGLAISYEKLGSTHTALGNLDKALGFFEERNRLSKELYADYPNNVSFKNGLAFSYKFLGRFFHEKKQDKAKARLYFEQCEALWRELATSFPMYVQFKNNLKWVQDALSDL